jgi:hypothetical protein
MHLQIAPESGPPFTILQQLPCPPTITDFLGETLLIASWDHWNRPVEPARRDPVRRPAGGRRGRLPARRSVAGRCAAGLVRRANSSCRIRRAASSRCFACPPALPCWSALARDVVKTQHQFALGMRLGVCAAAPGDFFPAASPAARSAPSAARSSCRCSAWPKAA